MPTLNLNNNPLPKPAPDVVPRVLMLFAGPSSNPHNLQHLLRARGLAVEPIDVCDDKYNNLVDDAVWDRVYARAVAVEYAALMASPPCSSFSRLRGLPNGPPVLRSATGRERYGLKN